jgi:RND family efflux transporter MFP subunit
MKTQSMVITALAGLGLLGATVQQALSANGAAKAARTEAVQTAARRPAGVAAEGRVVTYPGADVVVGTERAGRLVSMRVQEGQSVRQGELLAELESDELRAGLAEAQARIGESEAEIRLAEANLLRRERLVEQKILAATELDQARRDIEIARARRETALAEADRYKAQLRKTRILAPLSGNVVARHVDAGETLEANKPVATIADLGRLRVEAEADEADAGSLGVGASVAISAEGYPGATWRGSVEEIADSVTLRKLKPQDPSRPTDTRILSVKIAFAEKTPLKLGTTVELRIQPVR